MRFFTVPSDFCLDTVDKYDELNHAYPEAKVFETYGEMQCDPMFKSGRMSALKVTEEELKKYVEYSKKLGIDFNYVLNGSFMNNLEFTKDGMTKIKDLIKRLYQCGVKSFTVTLFPIIELIKTMNLDVEVVVSTITQINNTQIAQYFDSCDVSRIVVSESINRNFQTLKNIQNSVSSKVEVITNSICFIFCPFRLMHYNQIAAEGKVRSNEVSRLYYQNRCLLRRTDNMENYLKLAFIRPEDLKYYEDIGIQYFKIQGRQAVKTGDVYKTVKHYVQSEFDGNLMDLLNCFTTGISEICINNRDLDGFIRKFINEEYSCEKGCSNCYYCSSFLKKSLKSNNMTGTVISSQIRKNDLFTKMNKDTIEKVVMK